MWKIPSTRKISTLYRRFKVTSRNARGEVTLRMMSDHVQSRTTSEINQAEDYLRILNKITQVRYFQKGKNSINAFFAFMERTMNKVDDIAEGVAAIYSLLIYSSQNAIRQGLSMGKMRELKNHKWRKTEHYVEKSQVTTSRHGQHSKYDSTMIS